MSETFERAADILSMQDNFSEREVGVTHPDVSSHFRLRDNGDVEIISGEGLAFIFNRKDRSITLVADKIRFLTKEDDTALRWNSLSFNHKAVQFNEPAFLMNTAEETRNIYKDTDQFFTEGS